MIFVVDICYQRKFSQPTCADTPQDCRSAAAAAVSQGYELLNDKWYKANIESGNRTHHEAKCGEAGARLAIFDSQEDWEVIKDISSKQFKLLDRKSKAKDIGK